MVNAGLSLVERGGRYFFIEVDVGEVLAFMDRLRFGIAKFENLWFSFVSALTFHYL